MPQIEIRPFTATDRDWLQQQHAQNYAQTDRFDARFGVLVGQILDDFLAHADTTDEAGWIAQQGDDPLGSIFCVRQGPETAKLRLFFLVPAARGKGIGKMLLKTCMQFAQDRGYKEMRLWTHESHKAACGLYRQFGWQLENARPVRSFGQDLVEQAWIYRFHPSCNSDPWTVNPR